MKKNKKDTLINSIIFKKYKIFKEIGKGSFGSVYEGENIINKEKVAIKVEEKNSPIHLLEYEANYLSVLRAPGFPKLISYGFNRNYKILIEELLGENFGQIMKIKNYIFNLKDISMMAIQIIDRIEYLHSKGIVHRDIKPENFLLGLNDKTFIYLIDFGISRKYMSSRGRHLKYSLTGKLFGTLRFASYNATRGVEHSRRDDLESIGYMLVFLSGQKLPWQHYDIKGNYARTNYNKILELKKSTKPETICGKLPQEFAEYIKYCKNLKFEENPDYEKLRNLFRQILAKNQIIYDYNFSWLTKLKKKIPNIIKINFKKDHDSITSREKYINLLKRKQSPQTRLYHSIQTSLNNELSRSTKALLDNKIIEQVEKITNNNINHIRENSNNNSCLSREYISHNSINVHYNVAIDDIGKNNINTESNSKDIKINMNQIKNKIIINKKKFNLSIDLDKNFFMRINNKSKIKRSFSEKIKNNKIIQRSKKEIKRRILCENIYIRILNKYNNYIELIRKKIKMRKYNKINKNTITEAKNYSKKKIYYMKKSSINNIKINKVHYGINGKIKNNINSDYIKFNRSINNEKNSPDKRIIIINNNINNCNSCYSQKKYNINNSKKNFVNLSNKKGLNNQIIHNYSYLDNDNITNKTFERNNNINNNQQLNENKKIMVYHYRSIFKREKSKNNNDNLGKNFELLLNQNMKNSSSNIPIKNKVKVNKLNIPIVKIMKNNKREIKNYRANSSNSHINFPKDIIRISTNNLIKNRLLVDNNNLLYIDGNLNYNVNTTNNENKKELNYNTMNLVDHKSLNQAPKNYNDFFLYK